ncbi:MAG: hypothetical protein ACHQ50_12315 [Fimbriimonadales bacterium]
MSRDLRARLKYALRALLALGGLPLLGWMLARQIDRDASLAYAYAFASLFVAVAAIGFVTGWNWRKEFSYVLQDSDVQAQASAYATQIGLRDIEVLIVGVEEGQRVFRVHGSTNRILLEDSPWKSASPQLRDLFLARAVSKLKVERRQMRALTPYALPCIFLGTAASSVNLWLILPSTTAWVAGLLWYMRASSRAEAFEVDAMALSLTRNFETASEWIEEWNEYRSYVKTRERLDRLEAKANELGLTGSSH